MLMDFERLFNGSQLRPVVKPAVNLQTVMDKCIMLLQHTSHSSSKVQLVVDVDEHVPLLDTDEKWLFEILFSLLVNAQKFTQEGSVTLSARQRSKDKIEITVADTGIGIPAEDLPNMYQPCVQLQQNSGGSSQACCLALTRWLQVRG